MALHHEWPFPLSFCKNWQNIADNINKQWCQAPKDPTTSLWDLLVPMITACLHLVVFLSVITALIYSALFLTLLKVACATKLCHNHKACQCYVGSSLSCGSSPRLPSWNMLLVLIWTYTALRIWFSDTFSMSLCYPYLGDGSAWAVMVCITACSIHFGLTLVNTGATSYTQVCGFPALIEGYPGLWPITLDCQSLANSEWVCCSLYFFPHTSAGPHCHLLCKQSLSTDLKDGALP